uniref:Pep3/Vps18 RING C-terminal domain-containing protein n=1 Tax=Timema monikensis TaxID=170555 RepID=A0A7R9HQ91_9NEOP|nr:unnamed protein product [Timema monikensis]
MIRNLDSPATVKPDELWRLCLHVHQVQYSDNIIPTVLCVSAQHVVREKDDIEQAMQFLKECDMLKIEDILPFFSDFVTIDHFKDAICTSLQEYNQHIQDLKEEMEEATKSAEVIRGEIQTFRNRCSFVHSHDVCSLCDLRLLIRPFYLFPCGHRFHSDCLVSDLSPMLPPGKRNKMLELQRQLNLYSSREDTVSVGSATISARDQLKADIDSIVASECLFCGDMMIRSVKLTYLLDEKLSLHTAKQEALTQQRRIPPPPKATGRDFPTLPQRPKTVAETRQSECCYHLVLQLALPSALGHNLAQEAQQNPRKAEYLMYTLFVAEEKLKEIKEDCVVIMNFPRKLLNHTGKVVGFISPDDGFLECEVKDVKKTVLFSRENIFLNGLQALHVVNLRNILTVNTQVCFDAKLISLVLEDSLWNCKIYKAMVLWVGARTPISREIQLKTSENKALKKLSDQLVGKQFIQNLKIRANEPVYVSVKDVVEYVDERDPLLFGSRYIIDTLVTVGGFVSSSYGILLLDNQGVKQGVLFHYQDLYINNIKCTSTKPLDEYIKVGKALHCTAGKLKEVHQTGACYKASCVWDRKKPSCNQVFEKFLTSLKETVKLVPGSIHDAIVVAFHPPNTALVVANVNDKLVPLLLFVDQLHPGKDELKLSRDSWIEDYLKVDDTLEVKIAALAGKWNKNRLQLIEEAFKVKKENQNLTKLVTAWKLELEKSFDFEEINTFYDFNFSSVDGGVDDSLNNRLTQESYCEETPPPPPLLPLQTNITNKMSGIENKIKVVVETAQTKDPCLEAITESELINPHTLENHNWHSFNVGTHDSAKTHTGDDEHISLRNVQNNKKAQEKIIYSMEHSTSSNNEENDGLSDMTHLEYKGVVDSVSKVSGTILFKINNKMSKALFYKSKVVIGGCPIGKGNDLCDLISLGTPVTFSVEPYSLNNISYRAAAVVVTSEECNVEYSDKTDTDKSPASNPQPFDARLEVDLSNVETTLAGILGLSNDFVKNFDGQSVRLPGLDQTMSDAMQKIAPGELYQVVADIFKDCENDFMIGDVLKVNHSQTLSHNIEENSCEEPHLSVSPCLVTDIIPKSENLNSLSETILLSENINIGSGNQSGSESCKLTSQEKIVDEITHQDMTQTDELDNSLRLSLTHKCVSSQDKETIFDPPSPLYDTHQGDLHHNHHSASKENGPFNKQTCTEPVPPHADGAPTEKDTQTSPCQELRKQETKSIIKKNTLNMKMEATVGKTRHKVKNLEQFPCLTDAKREPVASSKDKKLKKSSTLVDNTGSTIQLKGQPGKVKEISEDGGTIELIIADKVLQVAFKKEAVYFPKKNTGGSLVDLLPVGKEVFFDGEDLRHTVDLGCSGIYVSSIYTGKRPKKLVAYKEMRVPVTFSDKKDLLLQGKAYQGVVSEIRPPKAFVVKVKHKSSYYSVFVFGLNFSPGKNANKLVDGESVKLFIDVGDYVFVTVQKADNNKEFEWVATEAWTETNKYNRPLTKESLFSWDKSKCPEPECAFKGTVTKIVPDLGILENEELHFDYFLMEKDLEAENGNLEETVCAQAWFGSRTAPDSCDALARTMFDLDCYCTSRNLDTLLLTALINELGKMREHIEANMKESKSEMETCDDSSSEEELEKEGKVTRYLKTDKVDKTGKEVSTNMAYMDEEVSKPKTGDEFALVDKVIHTSSSTFIDGLCSPKDNGEIVSANGSKHWRNTCETTAGELKNNILHDPKQNSGLYFRDNIIEVKHLEENCETKSNALGAIKKCTIGDSTSKETFSKLKRKQKPVISQGEKQQSLKDAVKELKNFQDKFKMDSTEPSQEQAISDPAVKEPIEVSSSYSETGETSELPKNSNMNFIFSSDTKEFLQSCVREVMKDKVGSKILLEEPMEVYWQYMIEEAKAHMKDSACRNVTEGRRDTLEMLNPSVPEGRVSQHPLNRKETDTKYINKGTQTVSTGMILYLGVASDE